MTPLDVWLSGQPAIVRALALEFPFGLGVSVLGAERWVVSWTPDGDVVLSRVAPGPDWVRARIERPVFVPVARLRGVR